MEGPSDRRADLQAPLPRMGVQTLEGDDLPQSEEKGTCTVNADHQLIWSVMLGCTSADLEMHNLTVHRFRVTASGIILGRMNDLVEHFKHVVPVNIGEVCYADAKACLTNTNDQLVLFCDPWSLTSTLDSKVWCGTTQISRSTVVHMLNLSNKALSCLPGLPDPWAPHWPVLADSDVWVLYLARHTDDSTRSYLGMSRFDNLTNTWVAIDQIDCSRIGTWTMIEPGRSVFGGCFMSGQVSILQGYVVIRHLILVSLGRDQFFCFNCLSRVWTQVTITGDSSQYIPFLGRAIYVEEDNSIYFFRSCALIAYKFLPDELHLKPPIKIDTLYPFGDHGNGFLAHLKERILCVVWISMGVACRCTTRHVLVTTFRVTGRVDESYHSKDFIPTGLVTLHSTSRRIPMGRSEACSGTFNNFCFLQEYQDHEPLHPGEISVLEEGMTKHDDMDPSVALPCCSKFVNRR